MLENWKQKMKAEWAATKWSELPNVLTTKMGALYAAIIIMAILNMFVPIITISTRYEIIGIPVSTGFAGLDMLIGVMCFALVLHAIKVSSPKREKYARWTRIAFNVVFVPAIAFGYMTSMQIVTDLRSLGARSEPNLFGFALYFLFIIAGLITIIGHYFTRGTQIGLDAVTEGSEAAA